MRRQSKTTKFPFNFSAFHLLVKTKRNKKDLKNNRVDKNAEAKRLALPSAAQRGPLSVLQQQSVMPSVSRCAVATFDSSVMSVQLNCIRSVVALRGFSHTLQRPDTLFGCYLYFSLKATAARCAKAATEDP